MGLNKYDRELIGFALRAVRKPIYQGNYVLNRFEELFHPIKCAICILFGRWSEEAPYDLEQVSVAVLNSGTGFTGEFTEHWFEMLAVGKGIFENWYYLTYDDSDV